MLSFVGFGTCWYRLVSNRTMDVVFRLKDLVFILMYQK